MKGLIWVRTGLAALIASAAMLGLIAATLSGRIVLTAQPAQAATTTTYMTTLSVDARGLASPMPVLLTRKTMKTMNSGETLEVRATDPKSMKNIEAFCKEEGNKILIMKEVAGEYIFVIEKF